MTIVRTKRTKARSFIVLIMLACVAYPSQALAPNTNTRTNGRAQQKGAVPTTSRRQWISGAAAAALLTAFPIVQPVHAAQADCFSDCVKNCKLIAPKDTGYCQETCTDYCSQPDRTDGLSGSVSSASGEVGILGGTFGTGTVVKGQDKPPSINMPGLDFTSGKGRKVIGY
jgi:hypothetical protein